MKHMENEIKFSNWKEKQERYDAIKFLVLDS